MDSIQPGQVYKRGGSIVAALRKRDTPPDDWVFPLGIKQELNLEWWDVLVLDVNDDDLHHNFDFPGRVRSWVLEMFIDGYAVRIA